MATVLTKQFQYNGTDDFDELLDVQVNEFIKAENIDSEDIISIHYEGHAALGVNTYSAYLVYKKK